MKWSLAKALPGVCGLLLMVLYVILQPAAADAGAQEGLRIISNAATIPGALLTALGLIVFLLRVGFWDGLRYHLISFFAGVHGEQSKYATFYDYMNRKKMGWDPRPLLITGLSFLLLAIILALLFHFL